jgi:hypothetical protein
MKAFVCSILFLVLVAVGGYVGFQYWSKSQGASDTKIFKTDAITHTGVLRKASTAASDFTHTITEGARTYGVASYSVTLDTYVGKTVKATGQNSGTTLYIDAISVVE